VGDRERKLLGSHEVHVSVAQIEEEDMIELKSVDGDWNLIVDLPRG